MTKKGHKALMEEMQRLKAVDRPKIIEEIERARAHGDLRENAEYHAAKEKYGFIQGRIDEISHKLAQAQVIEPEILCESKVVFGATVVIEEVDSGVEVIYQIVGEDEADVKIGLLNYQSPIARSLMGKTEGDEVSVATPKGTRTFEIIRIEFR